jgi:hypothetical protein
VLVVAVTAVAKLVTPMAVPIVPTVLTHQKAAIAIAARALARNPREAIRPFPIRSFLFVRGEYP